MGIRLLNKFVALALLFVIGTSLAVGNPVTMMDSVANKMINALKQNKSRLSQKGVITNIVNANLIPHVDLVRMSASAVGRKYWLSATSSQRGKFIGEFKDLMISTYAAALSSYDDDTVRFYPLRGGYDKRIVTVQSVIQRTSGQKIPINYNLVNNKGDWKVYDFSIENVSMVQSYRSQFAGDLARSGLSGLIDKLSSHNKKS